MGPRSVCYAIICMVVGFLLQACVIPQPVPQDIPSSKAEAVCSIQPEGVQAKPGSSFTAEVFIDPKKSSIRGAALEVEFNPKILQVQSAKPGGFLGKNVYVEKGYPEIDNKKGRVWMKASSDPPKEAPVAPGVFYELTLAASAELSTKREKISIKKAILINRRGEKIDQVALVPGSVQARFFDGERIRLDPITKVPRNVTNINAFPALLKEGAVPLTHKNADKVFRQFLDANMRLFRVSTTNLQFVSFKQVGEKRLIKYQQYYKNLPVYHATVGFLTASSGKVISYDGNYHNGIEISVEPKVQLDQAASVAKDSYKLKEAQKLLAQDSKLIVYPESSDATIIFHLAWKFMLAGSQPNPSLDYYFIVDAVNGKILKSYPRYGPDRVEGTVEGEVYPENPTAPPLRFEPFRHMDVEAGGRSDTTNINGQFDISPLASGTHTTTFALEGPFAKVEDAGGTGFTETTNCITGINCTLQWTEADEDGLNVFYHINLMHSWYQSRLGYSWVNAWTATSQFDAEVNHAFNNAYSGSPMLFGTNNYARSSDVVYHESSHNVLYHLYGDWIGFSVGRYIEGYAFDEGFADYFASAMTDDALHGEGTGGGRNLDNTLQYSGKATYHLEGHSGGPVIAGAAWDLRTMLSQEMGQIAGSRYVDRLVFNAHQIMANQPREYFFSDPQESNFLTSLYMADDDNSNLHDGVPHFTAIQRSFANHGLLQAVLNYGDSYDVSTNQLGSYSGGDFYISSSARLYANNLGQRGLRSLGDVGHSAFNELDIPESGYTRFGVPVVINETYVSLAQQGEEGNYIAFRVTDHQPADQELTVEYWYHKRVITLENQDSYDFSEQIRGTLSGGDFYLTDLQFYANNFGQQGVMDLGNLGAMALERAAIPAQGYTRFGVPAVNGHTYVALAGQGEDGYYIVFRIRGISGTSVTIEALYKKRGRVVLYNRDSYDFSNRQRGEITGGEFYLSGRRFWANNFGQRGLMDIGYTTATPLEDIELPVSGYTRFGVDAVAGHTYVSRAQQGEEGNYVVFNVVSTDGDAVTIDYVYRNLTTVTLNTGQSYDFSEHVIGQVHEGDFYLFRSKFYANNAVQRGVIDMGDMGETALEEVGIPETGYTRFGVDAVAGHTYAAMAGEGEEDNYIVFRVQRMDTDSVTIAYVYLSP